MTATEQKELYQLRDLWITRKATMKQMDRCIDLNRQEEFEAKRSRPSVLETYELMD